MKVQATVFVGFLFSASLGWACAGIQMSDGTCLSDPSLTREVPTTVRASSASPGATALQPLEATPTWQALFYKCSPDTFRRDASLGLGNTEYSSPADCLQKEQAKLRAEYDAQVAHARAEAQKNKSGQNAEGGGGGGSPSGGGGGGGDQAQGGQGGQEEQGQGQGEQQQAAPTRAAEHAPVQADQPVQMPPGTSCAQAVQKHVQLCEDDRQKAEVQCDPNHKSHTAYNEANKGMKDSATIAQGGMRSGGGAKGAGAGNSTGQYNAIDILQTSQGTFEIAAACRLAHRSCERKCLTVRKAFDQYCASAAPQEKSQAQQLVAKAEGQENGQKCSRELAQKADLMDQEAQAGVGAAQQNQEVAGQMGASEGQSGGGGGGAGDIASMLQGLAGAKNAKEKAAEDWKAVNEKFNQEEACRRAPDAPGCKCGGPNSPCLAAPPVGADLLSTDSGSSRVPASGSGY